MVLQRGERMLTHFEPDLVDWLMETFKTAGIDVRTGTAVEAIEKDANGYRVNASSNGREIDVEADLVVHAAGRVPALDDLDMDAAGVAVKDGRLQLNEYLQSVSNSAVYAAGGCGTDGTSAHARIEP